VSTGNSGGILGYLTSLVSPGVASGDSGDSGEWASVANSPTLPLIVLGIGTAVILWYAMTD